MRKLLLIFVFTGFPIMATAEDARMPEFLHMVAAAKACGIAPNEVASHFMESLEHRMDADVAKDAFAKAEKDVRAEFIQQGPVTVCLTTWEKLRALGFS